MPDASELSDEVKTFAVTRLAAWETPTAVAKAIKESFGIDVTPQRVEAYDPTKVAGKSLSAKHRALFAEARKRYLEDRAEIGIAQLNYRLRMYERIAVAAEARGNVAMALAACEQAAKDDGGGFTNKFEHQHDGQVALPLTATVVLTGRPDSAPAKPAPTQKTPIPPTKGARDGRKH